MFAKPVRKVAIARTLISDLCLNFITARMGSRRSREA